ncbi:calcium-binding protein [Phaeobacter sp. C3_T13_0]|uniref:calcium-binding protein n=1 Tax=Phaeobacter cretensis TaxID=3342641 RepID=UPI0039BD109D
MARILGTAGDDRLDGTSGSDEILGFAGNDSLFGGVATVLGQTEDSLFGGVGDDTLNIGTGGGFASGGAGNDTIISGFESSTITGGQGDDHIQFSLNPRLSSGNTVDGGAGNDTLSGTFASSDITGGSGNDRFELRSGSFLGRDNQLSGGDGFDTLTYTQTGVTISVFSASQTSIEAIEGANIVGSRSNDWIDLRGIQQMDREFYRYFAGEPLVEVDLTVGLGAGNDRFWGSEFAEAIYANTGTDTIIAGGGHDFLSASSASSGSLSGGDGDDFLDLGGNQNAALFQLSGGEGTDTLRASVAHGRLVLDDAASIEVLRADALHGSEDDDYIDLSGVVALEIRRDEIFDRFNFDLKNGDDVFIGTRTGDYVHTTGSVLGDKYYKGRRGHDELISGTGNDTLIGGWGQDTLVSISGADRLLGGRGADRLEGGSGNDRLFGQTGADNLQGGGNNDTLKGGRGQDTLDGGSGNDLLFGGGGGDSFVFTGNFGHDTIVGFNPLQDGELIDLSALGPHLTQDLLSGGIASQNGIDVSLVWGDYQSITIRGIGLSALDVGDFIFTTT